MLGRPRPGRANVPRIVPFVLLTACLVAVLLARLVAGAAPDAPYLAPEYWEGALVIDLSGPGGEARGS